MTNSSLENIPVQEIERSQYASFLLRCQTSSRDEIRIRILDLQTGQTVATAMLDDIPELIRSLFYD